MLGLFCARQVNHGLLSVESMIYSARQHDGATMHPLPTLTLPALGARLAAASATYLGVLTHATTGEPYVLLRLDATHPRADHETLANWAAELDADLPTPTEAAHFVACGSTFPGNRWIWLNKLEGSSFAWFCYRYGSQGCNDRSAEGGAVAVRRLPLESFAALLAEANKATEQQPA